MTRLLLLLPLAACAHPHPRQFRLAPAAAEVVAPGLISTEHTEIRLAASPDGHLRLWGSTNRPGGAGGWDVWLSRDGGAPEAASFNSDANDFDPAFSADGRFVYFFSNRAGGLGGDDLYRAPVTADGFGPAENLGPEVNTDKNEWAPSPSPDGKLLLFATDGRGGKGRHDLFVAHAQGAGWGGTEPLPGAVNTAADEFDATFVGDASTLLFTRSTNVDEAPMAISVARRGTNGFDVGTPLPLSVNVDGGYVLGPSVDGSVLYFSAVREGGPGRMDLYQIHFRFE